MADSTETKTETLTAQCYCKSVHFTLTLPTSALPLPVHLCHCSICRYTHGTLCIFLAGVPRDIAPQFIPPSSLSTSLSRYVHPKANFERFFCKTCGCHIGFRFLEGPDKGRWVVATSIFDQHGEDVFKISSHTWTESAPGGGLYEWLPRMGDREMEIWNPSPDDQKKSSAGAINDDPKQEFDEKGNEVLRAECHCGGVSFTFPRPTLPEVTEDPYLSKFISPIDKNKWMACLDVCDDCRLMDGTHVVGWTFVPLSLCEPKISSDLKFGTLTTFNSTPTVKRAFCSTCGATVFYTCNARKPSEQQQVVDIAVGILRAPEGVPAEKWLTWRTGRLAFADSGKRYDPVFVESLKKGFEEWGVKKYGEVARTLTASTRPPFPAS